MTFTGRSLIPTVVSCSFYATDYFMITKWQLPTALSLMGVPTLMAHFQCLNRHHWCFSVFAVTIYITGLSEYMSAWCISPLVVGLLLVASSLLHLVSPAGASSCPSTSLQLFSGDRGVVVGLDEYFTCVKYRYVGLVIMRHVRFTCWRVDIWHVDLLAGI